MARPTQGGWESEDELLRENSGISAFPSQDEEVDEDALLGNSDGEEGGINFDDLEDEDLIEVEIEEEDAEWIQQNAREDFQVEDHHKEEEHHDEVPVYNQLQEQGLHPLEQQGQQTATVTNPDEIQLEDINVQDEAREEEHKPLSEDEDSEEEDEGRGVRFKSERKEIVSTIRNKPKTNIPDIPDTLEISAEDVKKLNTFSCSEKKTQGRKYPFNNRGRGKGILGMPSNQANRVPNFVPAYRGGRNTAYQQMPRPAFRPGGFITSTQRMMMNRQMENNMLNQQKQFQMNRTVHPLTYSQHLPHSQLQPYQHQHQFQLQQTMTPQFMPRVQQTPSTTLQHTMDVDHRSDVDHRRLDVDHRIELQNQQFNNRTQLHQGGGGSVVHVNPHFKGEYDLNTSQHQTHKSIEESFGFPLPDRHTSASSRPDPLTMFQEQTQQHSQVQRNQFTTDTFSSMSYNNNHQATQVQRMPLQPRQQMSSQPSFHAGVEPQPMVNHLPTSLQQQQQQQQHLYPQPQQQSPPQHIPLIQNRPINPLLGNRPTLLQKQQQEPRGQPIQTVTGISQKQQVHSFRDNQNVPNRGQSIPTLGSTPASRPSQQKLQHNKPQQQQHHQNVKQPKISVQQRLGAQNVNSVSNITAVKQNVVQPKKTLQEIEEEKKKAARAQRFSNPPQTTVTKTAVKRLSSGSSTEIPKKQFKISPPSKVTITRTISNVKPEPSLDDIYSNEKSYKEKEEEQKRQRELIIKRKEERRLQMAQTGLDQIPSSSGNKITTMPTKTTRKTAIKPITMQSQPSNKNYQQNRNNRLSQQRKPFVKQPQGQNSFQNRPPAMVMDNSQQKAGPNKSQWVKEPSTMVQNLNRQQKVAQLFPQGSASNFSIGRGKKPINYKPIQLKSGKKVVQMSKQQYLRSIGANSGGDSRQVVQGAMSNRKVMAAGPAVPVTQGQRFVNRNVIQRSPAQRMSRKVVIENVAMDTNNIRLGTIAIKFGPFVDINVDSPNRRAYIVFQNPEHARDFAEKKDRSMVDMSIVRTKLVPE